MNEQPGTEVPKKVHWAKKIGYRFEGHIDGLRSTRRTAVALFSSLQNVATTVRNNRSRVARYANTPLRVVALDLALLDGERLWSDLADSGQLAMVFDHHPISDHIRQRLEFRSVELWVEPDRCVAPSTVSLIDPLHVASSPVNVTLARANCDGLISTLRTFGFTWPGQITDANAADQALVFHPITPIGSFFCRAIWGLKGDIGVYVALMRFARRAWLRHGHELRGCRVSARRWDEIVAEIMNEAHPDVRSCIEHAHAWLEHGKCVMRCHYIAGTQSIDVDLPNVMIVPTLVPERRYDLTWLSALFYNKYPRADVLIAPRQVGDRVIYHVMRPPRSSLDLRPALGVEGKVAGRFAFEGDQSALVAGLKAHFNA